MEGIIGSHAHTNGKAKKEVEVIESKDRLHFQRCFTDGKKHPFEGVTWEKRTCEIKGPNGEVFFVQKNAEFPTEWSEMASTVVSSKYFHGEKNTPERESSLKQLLNRVVLTISGWGDSQGYFATPADRAVFLDELTHILLHQQASFNSPVWFNVGVEPHPQCSACFILSVDDSMKSLLELQALEGALFKSGSGCGTNLSSIRSSREKLSGGGTASGPLSFTKGFDSWAGSIKSGGKTRRAAKMQILDVSHPDIIEFIQCKATEEKKAWALIDAGYDGGFNVTGGAYDSVAFQNANLSIRASDEFMEAAVNNSAFPTRRVTDGSVCEELRARDVLKLVSECAHICGDPGIQFDTTINEWHTCPHAGRINASNPCSEYMHLDNSACNLASINLLEFLQPDGEFALDKFLHVVDLLICAQDMLIDSSRYPSKAIERCARDFRQIGLGFANLGAMLMCLGHPYDSDAGRQWAAALTSVMTAQAYRTSARLAKARGAFRGFRADRQAMLKVIRKHKKAAEQQDFSALPESLATRARALWAEAESAGEEAGYRNSQTTVIAPTGTISFMMDCDTTGIEPDLALIKYKKLAGGGTLKIINRSVPRALKSLGYDPDLTAKILEHIEKQDTIEGCSHLKPEHLAVFDCAFRPSNGIRSIHYTGHLKMMGAVQPFISGAISKTVNLPQDTTPEEIMEVYVEAWRMGLKSVALYRDGSKRTQPLNSGNKTEKGKALSPVRRRLPDDRQAFTHKFSISGLEGYLTVGLYEDGKPGEIFLVVAKEGSTLSGLMDAFATSISIALQHGVPLATLIKKFTYMRFEPSGFTTNKAIPMAQSIVDYVFRWLALKFLSADERLALGIAVKAVEGEKEIPSPAQSAANPAVPVHTSTLGASALSFRAQEDAPPCIHCGASLMVRQAGCYYCLNCGSQGGCG